MDLTLQRPGSHHYIRSVSEEGIRVGDEWYQGPLILSAEALISNWGVEGINDIDEAALGPVFELEPEIVLLGTGDRQIFLPAELMMVFYSRGIGAEVMATPAACRTFNVLVSEERRVVAALLPGRSLALPQSMQGSSA